MPRGPKVSYKPTIVNFPNYPVGTLSSYLHPRTFQTPSLSVISTRRSMRAVVVLSALNSPALFNLYVNMPKPRSHLELFLYTIMWLPLPRPTIHSCSLSGELLQQTWALATYLPSVSLRAPLYSSLRSWEASQGPYQCSILDSQWNGSIQHGIYGRPLIGSTTCRHT
jgi:hypothetical protein